MDESHPEVIVTRARGLSDGLARAVVLVGLVSSCSGNGAATSLGPGGAGDGAGGEPNAAPVYSPDLPYARSVESFEPGASISTNSRTWCSDHPAVW
jgi:hypothetical protein